MGVTSLFFLKEQLQILNLQSLHLVSFHLHLCPLHHRRAGHLVSHREQSFCPSFRLQSGQHLWYVKNQTPIIILEFSQQCMIRTLTHLYPRTVKDETIYIYTYNTVVSVCSHLIGRVSRHRTPRSRAVWRAGEPVTIDTHSLACGSPMKRGRSLKMRSQVSIVDRHPNCLTHRSGPKIRSPECPESWRRSYLRVSWCFRGSFGNDSEPSSAPTRHGHSFRGGNTHTVILEILVS